MVFNGARERAQKTANLFDSLEFPNTREPFPSIPVDHLVSVLTECVIANHAHEANVEILKGIVDPVLEREIVGDTRDCVDDLR